MTGVYLLRNSLGNQPLETFAGTSMQLSKEEVSSVLRPSLLKFLSSSRTTTATEEETNLDSNSESGSTGPPQMVESVNTECWSDINECDINTDLTAPAMIEIIHRSVSILEKRIINVMVWREKKISRSAAVTGTAHGAISESAKNGDAQTPSHKISITKIQREELVAYVTKIASMYRSVLYHNFEHASHVLASSDSLITMVDDSPKKQALSQPDNHESPSDGNCRTTFGIADNPMMHLSLIFSALVHDVEHQGVGNKQLIDENDVLAIRYNGKSVAENNSLDVSLELLSKNCYSNLRISMFGDKENAPDHIKPELDHDEKLFRNIMYNVIQATDISSQDRLELNKAKWKRAFEETTDARSRCCMKPRPTRRSSLPASFMPKIEVRRQSLDLDTRPADSEDDLSELRRYPVSGADPNASTLNLNYLRASSVLEQFIQAADVAHSMQSWPIFVKWNTKLYDELWAARLSNRGPDVSEVWFKGQIGFFDGYINPLAKRLEECGVFGDQGHLFLTNATQNRERWLREGEALCEGMHGRVLRLQDKSPTLI